MMMETTTTTSRQRMTGVSSGMPHDDEAHAPYHHGGSALHTNNNNASLVESSVSTDAEQDKYNKIRRRKKQQQRRSKKKKGAASMMQTMGLLALFVVVLMLYHVFVKVQRDRQRHAKALYERAQAILKNLDESNRFHEERRHHQQQDGGYYPPPGGANGGGFPGGAGYQPPPPRGYRGPYQQQQQQPPPGFGYPQQPPPGFGYPQQPQGYGYQQQPPPGYGYQQQQQQQQQQQEPPRQLNIPSGATSSTKEVEESFAEHRLLASSVTSIVPQILRDWISRLDADVINNVHGGIRWIRPYLLPGMDDLAPGGAEGHAKGRQSQFFQSHRADTRMKWQDEWDALVEQYGGEDNVPGPPVDYTDPDKYEYPPLMDAPPEEGGYPQMTSLGDMMAAWDQDDDNEDVIHETLLHFDFSNPEELAMAQRFRDAMLPFKLYNVPELSRATELWTDEYVADGFGVGRNYWDNKPKAQGGAQESPNHYFAFFTPHNWKVERMGIPPTRNADFDFAQWAQHARYADAARLAPDQPHFYWQSGVDKTERHRPKDEWTFISKDLPSWSATEPNFIMFNPESEKGIQCRFGERGVVAATHYDSGRNMVGMITGAKRYILSPPNACGKLGIFPDHKSPIYRHSLLNFGHIKYLDDPNLSEGMSDEEREWLQRAATAPAVETVLKAGEVLYIPSFWFHYIISVQKSAQCNARSGVETEQHWEFGGAPDVKECPVM